MNIDSHIIEIPFNRTQGAYTSQNIYPLKETMSTTPVTIKGKQYNIVNWGDNNQIPYRLIEAVEKNSVMLQNKYFNLLTAYGHGLEYNDLVTINDKEPKKTTDPDIRRWIIRNNIKRFFAEQIVDLKYFAFAVSVIILNRGPLEDRAHRP